MGVAPMQCLQVRSGKMGWQNFYDSISGFDYTPGYTYRLQVLETKVENPPADGSNRTYEFIRILSQKGTPASKNSHIQGTWKLVSFNGKDVVGNYTAMIESDKVSFHFCNTVFGSYSLSGNVFVAPALASTKMYCQ
jgi:heat shock protein HslJ